MRLLVRKERRAEYSMGAASGSAVASQLASRVASWTLAHMNLGASALKPDLVHRHLHQVDAAAVLRLQPFDRQRVGNRIWIKPLPLVRDYNGNSISKLTLTANVNKLVSVHRIAVNDCIA
jgi:hypothetical protein